MFLNVKFLILSSFWSEVHHNRFINFLTKLQIDWGRISTDTNWLEENISSYNENWEINLVKEEALQSWISTVSS